MPPELEKQLRLLIERVGEALSASPNNIAPPLSARLEDYVAGRVSEEMSAKLGYTEVDLRMMDYTNFVDTHGGYDAIAIGSPMETYQGTYANYKICIENAQRMNESRKHLIEFTRDLEIKLKNLVEGAQSVEGIKHFLDIHALLREHPEFLPEEFGIVFPNTSNAMEKISDILAQVDTGKLLHAARELGTDPTQDLRLLWETVSQHVTAASSPKEANAIIRRVLDIKAEM